MGERFADFDVGSGSAGDFGIEMNILWVVFVIWWMSRKGQSGNVNLGNGKRMDILKGKENIEEAKRKHMRFFKPHP